MRTPDYVDALRVKLDCRSDYELAKRLGVQQNQIARYRKGGTFDNTMAARVAGLLDIDPLEVIGDMELERAKSDATREQWAKIMARFSRIAASAAGAALLAPQLIDSSRLFILCKTGNSGSRMHP